MGDKPEVDGQTWPGGNNNIFWGIFVLLPNIGWARLGTLNKITVSNSSMDLVLDFGPFLCPPSLKY